jgi:hypothetical protein
VREVKLSFRAQSLDNLAPDDMQENNLTLAVGDSTRRQALVRCISRVSISGTQIFAEGATSVFLLGDEFVRGITQKCGNKGQAVYLLR